MDDVLGPSPRETKIDNVIKQINNARLDRVNTTFEQLDLKTFLVNYTTSAHNHDYSPNVVEGEKVTRGWGGNMNRGLCKSIIKGDLMGEHGLRV